MKEKGRFISIDDSGESIFTFDEADMIIDTKTNIIYGANNIPDLVKILNSQSLQWQKLKEWIEEKERKNTLMLRASAFEDIEILNKMKELEKEDE